MAYTPEYSVKDIKGISLDTVGEAGVAVKSNAGAMIDLKAASVVGELSANNLKKMFQAVKPLKMK